MSRTISIKLYQNNADKNDDREDDGSASKDINDDEPSIDEPSIDGLKHQYKLIVEQINEFKREHTGKLHKKDRHMLQNLRHDAIDLRKLIVQKSKTSSVPKWLNKIDINENDRVGVLFCHGRKHREINADLSNKADVWIYIDKNPNSNPDIVGDINHPVLFDLLGQDSADYVVFRHCPNAKASYTADADRKFYDHKFLATAAQLLKSGGKLYWDTGLSILVKYAIADALYAYKSNRTLKYLVNEQIDYICNKYGFEEYTVDEKYDMPDLIEFIKA